MSIFAVIITAVVVVFFGAVVDLERALQTRHDAHTLAQEAARAGAGHIDLDRAYTRGQYIVGRPDAVRAARTYLHADGHTGTVTTEGAHTIRVRVHLTRPALFLPIIGITALHTDATATATLTTEAQGPRQP
ncbi:pilus assembly protein TadG-related protein [Actinomadura roseirufa]|uniref:pilus assembly protein TadG-related protein n=1 Tax=Actinomadura roseirufa TaxID=2094049 RepID=UPI0013F15E5C|nr:pilus assembly protein TadG-related protein [Actinomadura roseirufa]